MVDPIKLLKSVELSRACVYLYRILVRIETHVISRLLQSC